ncbi:MAG TPA: hypothetical protein VLC47_12960 [Burkholderiales bacterium]|nr:hypothetical protein [Burkholderiales bacterium]
MLLTRLMLSLTAWAGAASIAAFGQPPAASAGAVAKVESVTARVEAVDRAAHTITLRPPRSSALTFAVGPEVRNFGEFRAGDLVVVRYLEALSIELKKAGADVRERVESDPGGSAPRVTIAANVIAKDARKRTVTLHDGKQVVEVKVVSHDQFRRLQVGDRVEATFTEATVISIELAVSRRHADVKQ